jgi:CxxC-x17-CxxC domain-containing protein
LAQADKTLTCRDCGTSFVFTQGEQAFYASKGLTNEPTRCPDCRSARKRAQGGSGGGSYSSGGYSSGGNSYSGGGGYSSGGGSYSGGGGYGGGGAREMFDVTCDSCGKPAKVPFQPRGDRPVYCSDCFQQQRSSRSSYGGY